jgi:ferritin-like metal-binding protein YciE
MESLYELFEDTLKDIYFAEKQIVKALPKMARKASSYDLSDAFNTHLEETKVHVERLEQVFKMIDKSPRGKN